MLIHEDKEMEKAALDGMLCICVPVSVWIPTDGGEAEITAYQNVWDTCREYMDNFKGELMGEVALDWLWNKVEPVAKAMGYTPDRTESRVVREYRIAELSNAIKTYAENAKVIRNTDEIDGMECLCLHKPEPGEDEWDACAVVICDGAICAVAGLNDMFSDDTYEIYVETAKAYRGRGLATAAVAALSEHLINHDCTVGYKCGEDNKASAAVAEKLGMKLDGCRFDMVCYAE